MKPKPKRKWMYIEKIDADQYLWFSDRCFEGYTTITLEDVDDECNLRLIRKYVGQSRFKMKVSDLFEVNENV